MGLHNITMLYNFKWCTLFHINSYYIKRKYSRNIRHHDGCFLHMIFCCFSPLFEYWPQSITRHRWGFMNQHLEILKHCHCFRTNLHLLPTAQTFRCLITFPSASTLADDVPFCQPCFQWLPNTHYSQLCSPTQLSDLSSTTLESSSLTLPSQFSLKPLITPYTSPCVLVLCLFISIFEWSVSLY